MLVLFKLYNVFQKNPKQLPALSWEVTATLSSFSQQFQFWVNSYVQLSRAVSFEQLVSLPAGTAQVIKLKSYLVLHLLSLMVHFMKEIGFTRTCHPTGLWKWADAVCKRFFNEKLIHKRKVKLNNNNNKRKEDRIRWNNFPSSVWTSYKAYFL